jgi:general secretion pathway protein I
VKDRTERRGLRTERKTKKSFSLSPRIDYARRRQSPVLASSSGGFTLIEVLATLLLMAIVLPIVMRGITMATQAADASRHRTEAAGLAQSEMAQILASQSWQNGNQSGDFGTDWPQYTWDSSVTPWAGDTSGAGLQQIDVSVYWSINSKKNSVTLSSLAYPRTQSSTSTTTQ